MNVKLEQPWNKREKIIADDSRPTIMKRGSSLVIVCRMHNTVSYVFEVVLSEPVR